MHAAGKNNYTHVHMHIDCMPRSAFLTVYILTIMIPKPPKHQIKITVNIYSHTVYNIACVGEIKGPQCGL